MIRFQSLSAMALLFSLFFLIAACGDGAAEGQHDHDGATVEAVHGEGQEYTSAYVCPMHCEGSGAETAGTCPECGMDYVKLEDHVADGHDHD